MTLKSWLFNVIEENLLGGRMDQQTMINAVIAGLMVIGTFVLLVLKIAVPEQVWNALLLIVGFYFGHVTGLARARLIRG